MLRHIWEFVVAVVQQWGLLATGGIVVAAIGIYERASGRPIVGLPLWIAVTASIIAAFFSAWRKERLQVESFSQQGRQVRDYLSRSLTPSVGHLVRISGVGAGAAVFHGGPRIRSCGSRVPPGR